MSNKDTPRRHSVLRAVGPGGRNRIWDLLQDTYTIGRVPRVGDVAIRMVIPGDPTISRHQCSFVRSGNAYELHNVSGHGTVLNGRVVMDRARLRPGDEVRLGQRAVVTYDVLSDEQRRLSLARKQSEAAEQAANARVQSEKKTPIALFASIGLLWVGAAVVMLAGRGATSSATAVSFPVQPFLAADLVPEAPLGSNLRRAEASEVWARVVDDWKRDVTWKPSATHEMIAQGVRLLGEVGYRDLHTVSDDPIATTVRREAAALEARLDEALQKGERAAAAGDMRRARASFRTALQSLAETGRPLPIRRYLMARLAR